MLTSLFAFIVFVNAQSNTLVPANLQTPAISLEKTYTDANAFNGYDHDNHGGCDKCKKSKKHGACNQPGNHYGKHKKHGKHHGSSHNSCCQNNQNRNCSGNDRWSDRNRRDRRNDRWGNDNQRNRRDDTRYGSDQRDSDNQYRGVSSRTSQRRVNGNTQVKTNRPGTARRVGSRPTSSRPAGSRL